MGADRIRVDAGAADLLQGMFEHAFRIDAEHPSLPGHFPGHPLVPGVILLEQVAIALRAWRGQRLSRVLDAKFVAPLLPDEPAIVRLTAGVGGAHGSNENTPTERVRFEIFRHDTLLARGTVEGAA